MKWQAPSERAQEIIAAPIAWAAVIVSLPFLAPVIGLLWLSSKMPRVSQEWHPWFAWKPVPLDHWSDHVGKRGGWAWLEKVERRARPYNWPTEYRSSETATDAAKREGEA